MSIKPVSQRKIRFPVILATAVALAFGSSLGGSAYAAKQSPMHESSYSYVRAAQKRAHPAISSIVQKHAKHPAINAAKQKSKETKKPAIAQKQDPKHPKDKAVAASRHEQNKKPTMAAKKPAKSKAYYNAFNPKQALKAAERSMPLDVLDASRYANAKAPEHARMNWKSPLVGSLTGAAFTGLYLLAKRLRRKKGLPKSRLKAKLARIVTRFKEHRALRKARHIIMAQAPNTGAIFKKSPALTAQSVTRRAMAIARSMKKNKKKKAARRLFLEAVEMELTRVFSPDDSRLRLFYAGLKSL